MQKELVSEPTDYIDKIVNVLKDFISEIPSTSETQVEDPTEHSRKIANKAAANAAIVSGGLAMPPGPLGIVTILPDLLTVWKIQAQMVSDIAGTFGKKANLTQEQMLYCLFRHAAGQAVRDLAVRVGERIIIKRASLRMIQRALQKIGVKITQRLASKFISRWLPVAGAVGIGAYAFYDTAQVAKTTMELMAQDIEVEQKKSEEKEL
jgi:hypothetical protein